MYKWSGSVLVSATLVTLGSLCYESMSVTAKGLSGVQFLHTCVLAQRLGSSIQVCEDTFHTVSVQARRILESPSTGCWQCHKKYTFPEAEAGSGMANTAMLWGGGDISACFLRLPICSPGPDGCPKFHSS